MFNPKFTFESFVVGSNNNNFACAAAQAVAAAPGKSYNPLFICGGVGLGKTHLLHAIGQHISRNNKDARIAFLSAEKFTGEFIDAIRNNHADHFREKYLQTDVLLIDDIHFLAAKERIQEEFFHLFNALHAAHKQIVMACSCPPEKILGLEQRLVSRFEWGLVTDLQLPDAAMRLAILRKKAQWLDAPVPDAILNILAARFHTDIRRLENALLHVTSHAVLADEKLTSEVIEGVLREVPNNDQDN